MGINFTAAMIYADFVYRKANWLPKLNRPDTAKKFKDIPLWVSDYIPNTESQRNNKPMSLSDESETIIIAVNIASESILFTLSFDAKEYGIADRPLPDEFRIDGTRCAVSDRLEKDDIRVYII